MTTRVLALDPGKTTGACWLSVTKDGPDVVLDHKTDEWTMGELWGFVDCARGEGSLPLDVIVAEAFLLYPWMASKQAFRTMEAPRALGLIEYAADRAGVPLVQINAGTYKPRTKDLELGRMSAHKKDALRLGLFYLATREVISWQDLV